MDVPQIRIIIFKVCIIPLLGALTAWLIAFINTKKEETILKMESELEKKYLNMLTQTITDCVIATNQTYVDALKKEGKFDAEAQKIAFTKTFNAVKEILSDDALEYLQEALGDLDSYINQKIEAEVKLNKA